MNLSEKLALLNNPKYNPEDDISGNSIIINNNEESDKEYFVPKAISIDSYLNESGYKPKKSKSKDNKSKSKLSFFDNVDTRNLSNADRILENANNLLEDISNTYAYKFDFMLESNSDEEDSENSEEEMEMKNHLVSMGRKYARDNSISKESSEITKAFADSEKKLRSLYSDIETDKQNIQKDLDRMRVPGRASAKSLSDLVLAKRSLHDSQISIIKEINSIRKSQFDLRAKELARKEAQNISTNDISSNTLQSIFSSSRNNLVKSMGGYSNVSGATSEYDEEMMNSSFVSENMSDEEIHNKYFKNDDFSSEADAYLKYEDQDISYVLIIDDDDHILDLFAEDSEGNRVFDYPLPKNYQTLTFDIDHSTESASDNLHRNYKIRYA